VPEPKPQPSGVGKGLVWPESFSWSAAESGLTRFDYHWVHLAIPVSNLLKLIL